MVIKFYIIKELVRFIVTCLDKTRSKLPIGKYLSPSLIDNDLKQECFTTATINYLFPRMCHYGGTQN